jgi:hypothetical protein
MANDKTRLTDTIGDMTENVSGVVREAYAIATDKAPPAEELPLREEERHKQVLFERTDVPSSRVIIGGFAVVAGLWIAIALLYPYFAFLNGRRVAMSPPPLPSARHGHSLPPEPRLQQSPPLDMQGLLSRENSLLNHYAWMNKSKGIVAIPLDRAIRIVAERGIPPKKTPPNIDLSKPEAGTRLTGFEGKVEPEPR